MSLIASGWQPEDVATDIDEAEAQRAIKLLIDPAEAFQLAIHGPHTHRMERFGGGDVEAAVVWAVANAGRATAVQINPQPIPGDLGRNVLVADPLRWRWLIMDIDPERPKETNATRDEKDEAIDVSYRVMDEMMLRGWPEPILNDTGGGVHLLYRVDEPNDSDWRKRMKRVFAALKSAYATPKVRFEVDAVNPVTHTRLPGFWNRKGPASPERPHRRVTFAYTPPAISAVPTALLLELAGPDPVPPQLPVGGLRAWASGGKGNQAWAAAALKGEAAKVRASRSTDDGGSGRNIRLYKSAFALGGFVPAGLLSEGQIEAALLPEALAVGLEDRASRVTIASGIRGGMEHPRAVPESQPQPQGAVIKPIITPEGTISVTQEKKGPDWRLSVDGELIGEGLNEDMPELDRVDGVRCYNVETLARVFENKYPEPRWTVHGLLSEGLNLLAGAPKLGKSILALNLGLTVAGGGKALGGLDVAKGDVLYLSLEDKMSRVRQRARLMIDGLDCGPRGEAAERLRVVTSWSRLDMGGLKQLDLWIASRKQPALVIVDVWNRFCPRVRGHVNAYSQDAEAMAHLKALADHHGVTVLVIHHTRKLPPGLSEVDDFISEVSGTLGLAGTADGIMALIRTRRDESQATLHFTGRDQGDGQFVVEFDAKTMCWKSLGTQAEYAAGPLQEKILVHLKTCGADGATAPEISVAIKAKPDAIRPALAKLKEKSAVVKRGNNWILTGMATSSALIRNPNPDSL